MKRWATALAVLLGMAWAGAAAAPAASAASTTCLVVDTSNNHSYATLQAAVNAAATGGTLFVTGTCTGTTEIGKNLTITGQNNGGTKTTTLNSGGQGPALTIDAGIAVTLNTMIIADDGNGQIGSDIHDPGGTVILNGSTVTGNTVGSLGIGAGIVNATVFPGGDVRSGGTVTLNNSSITGNTFWSWVQAA
jgi:hypothetical protein